MTTQTAAQALVAQLHANGVRHVFTVPGESFLPVLDALHDSGITVTTCRHEGGAAMMAEAVGKVTGKPGICIVTRGPGATNASAGVHVAQQDSSPMILFVGQIERGQRDREAFQELDYRAAFGPQAKWATEIEDPARVPEYVSRAFHMATAGRPGPVVMALPKDVLKEPCLCPPRTLCCRSLRYTRCDIASRRPGFGRRTQERLHHVLLLGRASLGKRWGLSKR